MQIQIQINITIIIQTQVQIQSQIQITIQMEDLLQAGRANPTHHAPAPPSLANTCIFSYMQGGPSRKSREKVYGERLHQSTDESPTKVQRNLIRVTM